MFNLTFSFFFLLLFTHTRHHNYSLPSFLFSQPLTPTPPSSICFPLFTVRKKKASMEYHLDKAYQIKGGIEERCLWWMHNTGMHRFIKWDLLIYIIYFCWNHQLSFGDQDLSILSFQMNKMKMFCTNPESTENYKTNVRAQSSTLRFTYCSYLWFFSVQDIMFSF